MQYDLPHWCYMKLKYLLPAGLLLYSFLTIKPVYAQDPITFTDEDGEVVSYGEEREWSRTIEFVFTGAPEKNYALIQTTKGNEVWITSKTGITEYHIGNNGQCGWPEATVPYEAGFTPSFQIIPEVDLYWNPVQVNDDYVVVVYTPADLEPVEENSVSPAPEASETIPLEKTPDPAEKNEAAETEEPVQTESAEITDHTEQEKSGFGWIIPGVIACGFGIGGAAYYLIRKSSLPGDEDEE